MIRGIYSHCIQDEIWLIREAEWARSLQNIREAQFAIGNGYLGTRGTLEGIPYGAIPGTYLAGVYDKIGSQVDELVNLPNPINFKFTVDGQKLDVVAMDVIQHRRILNMKKGALVRHNIYRDVKKRLYDYQSLRFVSMSDKNIGVMQIAITALDEDCIVDVNTGIDTSVGNTSVLTEGKKRHFRVRELGQFRNAGYLIIETLEKKHLISYWSGFYYEINSKKIFAKDNIFRLKFKKGQTVKFTKIFSIKHCPYKDSHTRLKQHNFKIFNKAFRSNIDTLLNQHTKAWDKLWRRVDVKIGGTANLQQNLRFNIYHMMICCHHDEGASSIGARSLSGEGYRGHIFWDAEIFLMPFYLFNCHDTAKNMLLYRYRCLDKAKELAKKEGYKGAKFAWESASTGDEETPAWARDIDGTITKVHTHQFEHHITADIAYAVYKYYVATEDHKFMEKFGYEMIFESARFWASRVEFNNRRNKYEINRIIGPDEFHIDVNNNAFTNMMAKWNLITAYKLFCKIKKRKSFYKKMKTKLNLKETEVKEWRKIANNIEINITKDKIIEQFDGYFKLHKVSITTTDENGIPLIPIKLKAKDLGKTQLIKQPDVLMLLCLLDDVFSPETKLANYNFYIPKTMHKSSLSPSMSALIACEVGDLNRAYNLFNVSLRTDISNLYRNTPEGIHAASLGGTWQVVVFGFAGAKIKKEILHISPRMPLGWTNMSFSLLWKKNLVKLDLTNDTVKVKIISKQKKTLDMGVFDRVMPLKPNKNYIFRREVGKYKKAGYY